jgi:hypothetical protein
MTDRVNLNAVGDVVLENAGQIRALGEPDRLAVFTRLQRQGSPRWRSWRRPSTTATDAAAAAGRLSTVMLLAVEQLPRRWVEDVEPELDDAWAGAAGLLNVRVPLTAAELNALQQELEVVPEPLSAAPRATGPTAHARCGCSRTSCRSPVTRSHSRDLR